MKKKLAIFCSISQAFFFLIIQNDYLWFAFLAKFRVNLLRNSAGASFCAGVKVLSNGVSTQLTWAQQNRRDVAGTPLKSITYLSHEIVLMCMQVEFLYNPLLWNKNQS